MKQNRILSFVLAVVMISALAVFSASAAIGDLNGNNVIEAKDYLMLKRYVMGTFDLSEEQLVAGDVNGDGVASAKDYLMLKRIVLGTYAVNTTIDTIEAALESKGELSTSFTASYMGKQGDATVSFEMINGILTLCGHLDITSMNAVVDITIPLSTVASNYSFSGSAVQTNFSVDISGKLVAKDYSIEEHTLDVKFEQTAGNPVSGLEDALMPICKTAMDEFLKQANNLLTENNVGVNIGDLGFTNFYGEI